MLACALGGVLFGSNVSPPKAAHTAPTAFAAREPMLTESAPAAHLQGARSPIRRDRDGLFRVAAVVEGIPLTLIVDTGATTTVLTGADAARIGLRTDRRDRADTITTAAGPSAMRWARTHDMRIAGVALNDMEVAIIDKGLATSLLGQNMLDRLGPFTIDGNTLSFGRRE